MKNDIIRLGITGPSGRMGKMLLAELETGNWPALDLFGTTGRADENPEAFFAGADLVIDFSAPEATARYLWLAAKHRTPILVGTTGLTAAQESEMNDAAKETAVLYAANTSIGVALLTQLVELAAAKLGPEWDIEISETHHRHKQDAPSGTAKALGQAAAKGRAMNDASQHVYNHADQAGPRVPGTIGYAVQRGGDVTGEHSVTFYGEGERITLGHIAGNRALFARGALRGALWLYGQKPGLYSMRDALDL